MKLETVESSNIHAIGYIADKKTLVVEFKGEPTRVYVYTGVAAGVYSQFRAAESKGAFFSKTIRPRYMAKEITHEELDALDAPETSKEKPVDMRQKTGRSPEMMSPFAGESYALQVTKGHEQMQAMVQAGLWKAVRKHGPIASAHEGYAVILEELDELKAEVWKKEHDPAAMYEELQHIAAMAFRVAIDLQLIPETRLNRPAPEGAGNADQT
jgi:hypothetical protein